MFAEPTIYAGMACLILGSLYWRLQLIWLSVVLHLVVPPVATLGAGLATGYIGGIDSGVALYLPYLAVVPYLSSAAGAGLNWCLRQRTASRGHWATIVAFCGYTYYLLWFLSVFVGGHQVKSKWQNLSAQNTKSGVACDLYSPCPFVLDSHIVWGGDMYREEITIWFFGWNRTLK